MSKKEEIIILLKQGVCVQEIVNKGYKLKYVKQIEREYNKLNGRNEPTSSRNEDKIESNYNEELKDIRRKLEALEEQIMDILVSNKSNISETTENILENINEVKNFIESIQKNTNHIKNFKAKFIIDWDISYYNKNKKTKMVDQTFNPVDFYTTKGKEQLSQRLHEMREEKLKEIVKVYVPDPRGYAQKWNNKERLIQYIIDRVISFADSGKVFYT